MLTDRRTTSARREGGFTLVELLVVMIIIGVLAAVAIPVFLTQRRQARDTATKADVSRLGKEVAAFYVDGDGPLTLTATGTDGADLVVSSGATTVAVVRLSSGTTLQVPAYVATAGSEGSTWCVGLTNGAGAKKSFAFSAQAGLREGSC